MTEIEIQKVFDEAVRIEFRPYIRTIALTFPNEYEADESYSILKGYFKNNPITLRLYKKEDSIDLYITCGELFIKSGGLEYYQHDLDRFIEKEDKSQPIRFTTIWTYYLQTLSVPNFKDSDRRNDIAVIGWELS